MTHVSQDVPVPPGRSWQPGRAKVTNRDFRNLEVISSSVKVWKDGRATKARYVGGLGSHGDVVGFPWEISMGRRKGEDRCQTMKSYEITGRWEKKYWKHPGILPRDTSR